MPITDTRYGVELEFAFPRDPNYQTYEVLETLLDSHHLSWCIDIDASLDCGPRYRCYEVQTPILQSQESLVELWNGVSLLQRNGARVNKTCGLHVHMESRNLPLKVQKAICRTYLQLEPVLKWMHPFERHDHHYAGTLSRGLELLKNSSWFDYQEPIPAKFHPRTVTIGELRRLPHHEQVLKVMDYWEAAPDRDELRRRVSSSGKYSALNICLDYETFEFRQAAGSVSAERVTMWVRFLHALFEHASRFPDREPDLRAYQNAPQGPLEIPALASAMFADMCLEPALHNYWVRQVCYRLSLKFPPLKPTLLSAGKACCPRLKSLRSTQPCLPGIWPPRPWY